MMNKTEKAVRTVKQILLDFAAITNSLDDYTLEEQAKIKANEIVDIVRVHEPQQLVSII